MKFGIFDYVDLRSEPLPRTYDERMVLIQAAEAAGFYGYHVTEHHATPLSAAPSPSVFLAAAARETTRIRLGALLFLLPLYHPFRLLEELQMLDNLSNGRLDIGVGRGVSPFEFAALGQDFKDSDEVYAECLDVIWQGLKSNRITYQGARYKLDNAPLPLGWVQKAHPPLWYGLRSGPDGSLLPVRRGMNVVTLGNDARAVRQEPGSAGSGGTDARRRSGRAAVRSHDRPANTGTRVGSSGSVPSRGRISSLRSERSSRAATSRGRRSRLRRRAITSSATACSTIGRRAPSRPGRRSRRGRSRARASAPPFRRGSSLAKRSRHSIAQTSRALPTIRSRYLISTARRTRKKAASTCGLRPIC